MKNLHKKGQDPVTILILILVIIVVLYVLAKLGKI